MVNPLVFSPTKPHFFQPLLPGFHHHLNIPVRFFMKHIEGGTENKMAKLKSDVSYRTWEVEMDGRRFTEGWKEFALDHDLQIGDILVFRHEGDMVFHVTAFGPSCCNLQYALPRSNDDDIIEIVDDEIAPKCDSVANYQMTSGNISRSKKVKKNSRTEAECSSNHSCFVVPVTASNLRTDTLYLPRGFSSSNGLNKRCCEIVLMNEQGRSWTLNLRHVKSPDRAYITRGWKSFCHANGQEAGGFFKFKLIRNGTKLTLRLSPEECIDNGIPGKRSEAKEKKIFSGKHSRKDERSSVEHSYSKRKEKKKPLMWRMSSSPWQNRFVTLTLSSYCVQRCRLCLPTSFTRVNNIKNPREIILLDKDGVKRPTNLLLDNKQGRMRLGRGWKDFCKANNVKTGESFVLELIWEDTTPMLKFCSKIKIE